MRGDFHPAHNKIKKLLSEQFFDKCAFYDLTDIFLFFSLSIFGILIIRTPSLNMASALEGSISAGKIISLENVPQ